MVNPVETVIVRPSVLIAVTEQTSTPILIMLPTAKHAFVLLLAWLPAPVPGLTPVGLEPVPGLTPSAPHRTSALATTLVSGDPPDPATVNVIAVVPSLAWYLWGKTRA